LAVSLPDAPALPGLACRRLRTDHDFPGMAAVRAACAVYDGVDPLSVAESVPVAADLERGLAPSTTFDPPRDVLLVTLDERIIGYSVVHWWTETDGTWLYLSLGWLVPEWRRRGIGTAMLHWAERRCHELAAEHSTPGKVFLGANASETEHDATALLQNEGYSVAFTVLEMGLGDLSGLRDVTLPPGFLTRPLQPSELPALFDSMNGCYNDHRFGEVVHYEDWVREQRDLSTWHVAWDEQTAQIAGQVQVLIHEGHPEIEEASVRAPYRRRGLARALIARALNALRDKGIGVVRLRTVYENPQQAWRVYESVGFRVLKRFPRYRKAIGEQSRENTEHRRGIRTNEGGDG
jgi:ribosomal protein S18 acetylase RimI-like enzyme